MASLECCVIFRSVKPILWIEIRLQLQYIGLYRGIVTIAVAMVGVEARHF